ncbi:hypothetical protein COK06_00050 [Bacillus cereus]|nr:hypothetical protein COI72_02365 [Bacillus cereus]PFQ00508.1 hypothetical protein COK06_00050 [Bacillus cereus]
MKILVVTQYYFPEIGAASKRLTELSRLWKKQGHEVHVFTAIPNYPQGRIYAGYEENKSFVEEIEGITVFRNSVDLGGVGSKFSRIKSYLSFMMNSYKNIKKLPNDYDVVITSTGPVFLGFMGQYISKRKKIPNILEFRDITFKSLKATQYTNDVIINLIKKLELYFCKKAKHVITVTETYKNILVDNGIEIEKISTIPNGYLFDDSSGENINTNSIDSILEIINKERKKGKKVIGYFGTLGVSQKVEEVVEQFSKSNKYSVLIIGNGARERKIIELAENSNSVHVFESISSKEIQYLYSQVDFNLIKILNDPAFSGTIPSKLFEVIGNKGVPLYIGPKGDAQEIMCSINDYLYYEDVNSMFHFLEKSSLEELDNKQLKQRGKEILLSAYDRERHAEKYLGIMQRVKYEI